MLSRCDGKLSISVVAVRDVTLYGIIKVGGGFYTGNVPSATWLVFPGVLQLHTIIAHLSTKVTKSKYCLHYTPGKGKIVPRIYMLLLWAFSSWFCCSTGLVHS